MNSNLVCSQAEFSIIQTGGNDVLYQFHCALLCVPHQNQTGGNDTLHPFHCALLCASPAASVTKGAIHDEAVSAFYLTVQVTQPIIIPRVVGSGIRRRCVGCLQYCAVPSICDWVSPTAGEHTDENSIHVHAGKEDLTPRSSSRESSR